MENKIDAKENCNAVSPEGRYCTRDSGHDGPHQCYAFDDEPVEEWEPDDNKD